MKTFNKTILALTSALAVNAYADYQTELGVSIGEVDFDGADGDIVALVGEFNFSSVDTSKGPLAEATFLDQSSYINIAYVDIEDIDTTSLMGRFVTNGGLIIEAGFVDSDGDDALSFGIGTYLNENLDLVVTYTDEDDFDSSALSVDLHGLNPLSGDAAIGYDLTVGYLDVADETGSVVGAGLTYYPCNTFGIGANVSLSSVDDVDTRDIGVSLDYFATEAFRLSFAFTNSEIDAGSTIDTDIILLGGSFRF